MLRDTLGDNVVLIHASPMEALFVMTHMALYCGAVLVTNKLLAFQRSGSISVILLVHVADALTLLSITLVRNRVTNVTALSPTFVVINNLYRGFVYVVTHVDLAPGTLCCRPVL